MSEVIQFPNADKTSDSVFTVFSVSEDAEICCVSSGRIARNIARLLAEDWWGQTFTVLHGEDEVFRVTNTEEDA